MIFKRKKEKFLKLKDIGKVPVWDGSVNIKKSEICNTSLDGILPPSKDVLKGKITEVDVVPFWSLSDGLTQSFLNEWLACKERAHLSYRLGYSSTSTSNALTFGSLFHTCLERYYNHLKLEIRPEKIDVQSLLKNVLTDFKKEQLKEKMWTPFEEENFILNQGYLEILFPAYLNKHLKKDLDLKWAVIEEQFDTKINEVRLIGKYDRVAVNKNNETWLFETKTKSIIDPNIQDRLSFDLQVMVYILTYQAQFKNKPVGFVYDIIKRPSLRKGKNETLKHFLDRLRGDVDDSYFMRIRMKIDQKEFDRWKEEFFQMLTEFKEWAKGGKYYRNPAACETRYGTCRMIRLCGLKDDTGLYKREKCFPELQEAK